MSDGSKRYVIIGGNPYKNMYTSLSVKGHASTVEEAIEAFNRFYDECGGLLMVLDRETGVEADISYTKASKPL